MKARATKFNVNSKDARREIEPANRNRAMKMSKSKSIMLAAATAVASLLGLSNAPSAHAAIVTLTDDNSSTQINTTGGVNSTPKDGLDQWLINGVNQINQQWFAFRVGSTGAAQHINSLVPSGAPTLLSTNGSTINYLQQKYISGASFTATETYILAGGQPGSGTSDLSETIKIVNTSGHSLDFHLFQYSEFNLGGTTGNETVSITGNNTATVVDAAKYVMTQTVVSPKATEYQADTTAWSGNPSITNLQHSIDTTSGLTLNDTATASANPLVNGAWGLEWDKVIATGGSYVITIDKQIHSIPEPSSTVALFGLGTMFLMRPRRRDEDPDPRTAQVAEA